MSNDLEVMESGGAKHVCQSLPREEAKVGKAQEANRKVIPTAGNEVLDDCMVADVGHRQHRATSRAQPRSEPLEKDPTLGQMLEKLTRDDSVEGPTGIDLEDVSHDYTVEQLCSRPRDNRVELDSSDTATKSLLNECACGAPTATDLEHVTAVCIEEGQDILPDLAVVIDEFVTKPGPYWMKAGPFPGQDRAR